MVGPAAVDLVGTRLEELTNALAATYNSHDAAPSLALAREAFLDACTQLQEQLMQLKQAVLQSPQQIENILHQQQQQQQANSAVGAKAQQAPTSTAAATADKMDVDQPAEQQEQQAAKEVSATIMQQHASFLAQLTGGPS